MAAAAASDRFGRKPLMIIGLIGGLAAGAYLFSLPHGADSSSVLYATLITLTFHGTIVGSMAPFFTELFPTHVRYSALSVSYQVASVVGGSVAPLIATLLMNATGTPQAVIAYAAIMVVPGVICVLLSRETRGTDLTAIASQTQERTHEGAAANASLT